MGYARIAQPTPERRVLSLSDGAFKQELDIDGLRDVWYETSYLLDRDQSFNGMAKKR